MIKLSKLHRTMLGVYGAFLILAAIQIIDIEGIEFDTNWLWCLTLGLVALMLATAKFEEDQGDKKDLYTNSKPSDDCRLNLYSKLSK